MPYSSQLAGKIRKVLGKEKGIIEKEMFGGLSFLVNGKMAVGVWKDKLVVRVNPSETPNLLKKPGIKPMDFTSRPMKGFVYVTPTGYKTQKEFVSWIKKGIGYARTLKK